MSGNNKEIFEAIENPVVVNATDSLTKLDLVFPERTIVQYKYNNFHLYKMCYRKRMRGKVSTKACVVKSSLCATRVKIAEKIIRRLPQLPQSSVCRMLTVYDWLDGNDKADLIHSEQGALETYYTYSESLYREARASAVQGKGRGRGPLLALQNAMALLLSISSGLSMQIIKDSAVKITRHDAYGKHQKRPAAQDVMQTVWTLHLRHFETICSFIFDSLEPPLVVPREDIGYPDYKQWTPYLDSNRLDLAKKENKATAMYFDENDEFIFDKDAAKARAKELNQRYKKSVHESHIAKIQLDRGWLKLHLIRKASIHFSHLLLLASGCNSEQLEYLDFSKKLSNTQDAKRQIATKPRAGYAQKPVQFSANFLPSWRKYLKLREIAIEAYDPDFGNFGIPLPKEKEFRDTGKTVLCQACSTNIRLRRRDPGKLGFPPGIEIPITRSARSFKTSNLLDSSSGNIPIVSKMMGRNPEVTRKHYAYNAFEDSARELTTFFDSLTKAASIKAKGYSPSAPIRESGARIHTGSCEANDATPSKIAGVTDMAPEPRCGAPVTCFFCEHFSHHADIHDIKLILSAKVWLQKQTKAISRNVDEHLSKFLPIMERIEDIIEDFRNQSDEYNLTYKRALSEIDAGNYSPYWRNKIDAFLSALEA